MAPVATLSAQAVLQDLTFINLTSTQGLSQNTVNCMLQDRQGFLWFGTANGLNRYDGYQFKVYQNELNNENSLSDNYVVALHEDRNGHIWVGTFGGGLNKFNPITEEFVRYQHREEDKHSIASNDIRAFYEDEEGRLWLGLYGGAFSYFDPVTQQFKQFPPNTKRNFPETSRVLAFLPEGKQGFWVGTMRGLFYFDRQKKAFTEHFWVHKHQCKNLKNMVYSMFRDRVNPHILWLCTFHAGLLKFDTHKRQITGRWEANPIAPNTLKTNTVMSFYQDKQGTYWVGTQKGFYQFNPGTNSFKLYPSDPKDARKIAGNNIQRIFEDKAGTLWLCSFKRGVSAFNPYLRNFIYYPLLEKNISQVSSFCEDQEGNIWFGNKGGNLGLACINRQSQTLKTFKSDPNNAHSLAANDVNILLPDIDGTIWIGTFGQGLEHYDPKTGIFKHYPATIQDTVKGRLHGPHIGALYQDKQQAQALWVGTRGHGLFKFDKKRQKFIKSYTHKKRYNGTKLSHPTIIAITKDYQGNVWLATRVGLSRLNPRKDVFTNYLHLVSDSTSISNNYISALHIDQNNILWIGTHNGLNRLDLKEAYQGKVVFKHYTTKQGLPNNIIHKIIEDTAGKLWLSTSKGLSCFDKTKEVFKNYDEQDGLQGNEFSTNSGLLTKDGAILMGGTNGFNLFYPEKIKQNKYMPPVVFTGFRINKKAREFSIKMESIWATDTVELSYKDKIFSVEFAALNYILPAKNTYAVLMENVDQNWRYIGHKRLVTYTDLEPGTYRLRVKTANNDGVWSKKEAHLVIIIHPAWWQTWWFKLIIICLLLVAGYYLFWRNNEALRALLFVPKQLKETPTTQSKRFFKSQDEITKLKQLLYKLVVEQEWYKDETISLNEIAKKMNITDKKLSELFNKELNTNFHDYINTYKINAFKEKVEQEETRHLKLISIAYDAGFHSKATFNRAFKKHTGLTPSQYREQIEHVKNSSQ